MWHLRELPRAKDPQPSQDGLHGVVGRQYHNSTRSRLDETLSYQTFHHSLIDLKVKQT